ncbi:MAG: thiamine biosynthesis protein [Deltaproteobacteria bacterium]|nr:thiamine biosynthesis protein [Deltaproteobacteria bacterium]
MKALGLFSGGLDSILAALVLREQGIEVTGVTFVTPFFDAAKALKYSAMANIPLLVRDIGEEHLEMLKHPRYGYGRNLNPCIDCHALMFRMAGRILEEEGFDFLFSGEVLGQRPMSQNASSLRAVAKTSGIAGRILRPLSAKLLPPTEMEESGQVDRNRLLDIQGRSRRRQEELARKWGLREYPSSGGGCLLTEKSFVGRLRALLEDLPDATLNDVQLLRAGRRFHLGPGLWLTVGRNQDGNEQLRKLAQPEDTLLQARNCAGPVGLVSGNPDMEALQTAAAIVAGYGKGRELAEVTVMARCGELVRAITVAPFSETDIAQRIEV